MKQALLLSTLLAGITASAQYIRPADGPRDRYAQEGIRAPDRTANAHGSDERGGPPANDDCANAQVITLSTDCFNPIEGDNTEATSIGPDASCDDPGGTLLDVWYTFTTGAIGPVAITLLRSPGMGDGNYVLYAGGCAGTEVSCRIAPVPGQQEILQPATQYWLRVYSNPTYGPPGAFTLCIQDLALVPAPPNDDCANVAPSNLAVGGSVTFTGDATYALNSEGLPLNSIWNAFTLSDAADVEVDLCGTTTFLGYLWNYLYVTCPADVENRVGAGTLDFSTCVDGNLHLCYGNLPAGTYYYAVHNGTTPGSYTLNIQASAVGTNRQPNDDCSGALPLGVGSSCAPVNFSPACASLSDPGAGCLEGMANAEDDVWYSFIASATDMAVGMFPHSTQFGPIVEVFAGSCGSLNSIGCANGFAGDSLEVVLDGLTIGATYYVQAYNGYASTPSDDPSYDLCVVEGTGLNIGIGENEVADAIDVFPNPSNGDFTLLAANVSGPTLIDVFDATGRVVLMEQRAANGPIQVHGVGKLVTGAYMVRMRTGTTVMQARFVVE